MSDDARTLSAALADLREAQAAIAAREDSAFQARFAELRRWQAAHVQAFHAERAAAHNATPLLMFLTHRFYAEADWSELTAQPQAMARVVERLVDRDRPLVIAVELQAAAERLDIAMTDALLDDDRPLAAPAYVRALRRVDQHAVRQQQMRWLDELIDLVADYADNRAAHWGFKLARAPAHTFGLGTTYDLLAEGFGAMREAKDLKPGVHEAIAAQRARLERLLGRSLGES